MKLKRVFVWLIAVCLLATLALPFTAFAATTNKTVSGSNGKDDTATIQAALDFGKSATASNPLVVTVKSGTYYISNFLNIYSYTTLKLEDGAKIVRTNDDVAMLESGYHHSTVKGYGQLKNVTITGGVWDGNPTKNSSGLGVTAHNLISLWHGENITIKDTTIQNCAGSHMIEVTAIKNFVADNITFKNLIKVAGVDYDYSPNKPLNESSIRSEALQIEFAGKDNSPFSEPFDSTPCVGVTVQNCTFDTCLGGIGNHHAEYSNSNITIKNNTFKNMDSACINLPYMKNVTVTGNTATNVGAFLRAIEGTTATVENNKISLGTYFDSMSASEKAKTKQDTFFISDSTVTLNKNTVTGTGKRVVVSEGSKSSVTVTNNTFDLTSKRSDDNNAIELVNGKATITGNKITSPGNNCISATSAAVTITGNTISGGTKDNSIYLKALTSGSVKNNTISKSKTAGIRLVDCTASTITVSGNTIETPGTKGISISNSKATVSSNKINSAKEQGILVMDGATVTANSNTISKSVKNSINVVNATIKADGNTITSPTGTGIYVEKAKAASTLSNNKISGSGSNAINITGTTVAVTISKNTVSSAKSNGIYIVGSTNVTASGNTVTGSTSCGINLAENSKATLSSNTVKDSGTQGIRAQNSTITAKSNTITNFGKGGTTYYGFYLEGATLTVSSNTITGKSGQTAIRAKDSSSKKASGSINYNKVVTCGKATNINDCKGKVTVKEVLSTPKLSSVSNTTTGVKVSWSKVSGAAKYRVFYKTGSGSWTKAGDTTSTSFTWKGAKNNTKYSFTVRCITSDGNTYTSDYNTTGKSITFMSAPTVSVSNVVAGVKISWSKVSGASNYAIFRKTPNGSYKKIGTATGTSYTDKTAKNNTKYVYAVRCASKDGKTYTSSYNAGKSKTFMSAPTVSVSNAVGGVKISWGKVSGASNYAVFRKTPNGSYKKIGTATGTSYTDKAAKNNTKYVYAVRCASKDGKTYTSSYNAGKSITFLSAPTVTLSKTSSGVQVKWSKVTGAENYAVFRKTSNGSYKKIGTATGTSYTDKTAKKGTKYVYAVRCVSKDGKTNKSSYNAGKSITF